LLEGAHSQRHQRADRPRAALSLLRELKAAAVAFGSIAVIATIGLAGCDQGSQNDQPVAGPYVQILKANVDTNTLLAQNDSIQIAFDRLLLPATIVRQSFVLVDSFGNPVTSPLVTYDPVTRVVTLSNPNANGEPWLVPGQPYKVVLPVPKGNDDQSGLRAIDRATLDPAALHQIGFQVAPARTDLPADPPMHFCRDVMPIFSGRCTSAGCHITPEPSSADARFPDGVSGPPMGLVLESSIGVLHTAIGRASAEANTGALAGSGRAPGGIFGVDMPIVAPGNPGNSWLMYKLLLAVPQETSDLGVATCNNGALSPVAPLGPSTSFLPLTADERTRLADHMRGNSMPYPTKPGAPENAQNLTFQELERVRSWITQGAIVEDCSACAY
jgi:hypothetical protein